MSVKSSLKKNQNNKYKSVSQDNVDFWNPQFGDTQDDQNELIPECDCGDHHGKVYLDEIFEMPFSYLFECLFEFNDFFHEFSKTRKISDFNADDWKIENDIKTRKAEYKIEISHAIASKYCKNIEHYKIVKYVENKACVIDTEAFSSGVIYSDCFKICHRYCLTGLTSLNKCRLKVHSSLNYLSKPNFVIKALIDKNCYASLNDFFKGMQESLSNECERLQRFQTPIQKTSADVDLKITATDNKSSINSSICSSKTFSSDDEISSSDEVINAKKKLSPKITKASGDRIKNKTEKKEKDNLFVKKRTLNHKQNEIENSFKTQEASENERKNRSRNMRIDVFIKFCLAILFILFIFNLMLYSKLREIEKIAVLIKHQYQSNKN